MVSDYPRSLNGDGCVYGQNLRVDFLEFKTSTKRRMDKMEEKLDKILWALVAASIGLATTAVGLILNIRLLQDILSALP